MRTTRRIVIAFISIILVFAVTIPAAATQADSVYGEPWIDSIVEGMAAMVERPTPQDDYYLYANYDYLSTHKVPNGFDYLWGHNSDENGNNAVETRLDNLIKEAYENYLAGGAIDSDTRLIGEFYDMCRLGATEADRELFFKYLDEINDISTMEELKDYLVSDACRNHGATLLNITYTYYYMIILGLQSADIDDPEFAEELLREWKGIEHDGQSVFAIADAFKNLLYDGFVSSGEYYLYEEGDIEKYTDSPLAGLIVQYNQCYDVTQDGEYIKTDYISDGIYAYSYDTDWFDILDPYFTDGEFDEGELSGVKYLDAFKSLMIKQYFSKYMNTLYYEGIDDEAIISAIKITFPIQLDQLYYAKYCTQEAKDQLLELMMAVRDEYKEMLKDESWLSEEALNASLEKLDNLGLYALYPDEAPVRLNEFKDSHETANGSVSGKGIFTALIDERDINEKYNGYVLYTEGMAYPYGASYTNNARYIDYNNTISYYAGYDPNIDYFNLEQEELYGVIAFVVGHEISHAFDARGSQYDAYGNYADLWSDSDREEFMARIQKISDYFSKFKPGKDGADYDGERLSDEVAADLGSLTCIMRIVKDIDGLDYDKLFKNLASNFSGVQTVENNEYRILNDEHPLGYLRVNVMLSQQDEFLEYYGIKPGDKMYVAPEDRIGVWGMDKYTVRGDSDGDSEVTILDATAIQRYLASLPTGRFNRTAADADSDSEITILDATAIQRFLASLPCEPGIGAMLGERA